MKENNTKQMFDCLNPTSEQKEMMWEQIEKAAQNPHAASTHTTKHRRYRAAAIVLAILCGTGIAGVAVNAATDGLLLESIANIFHVPTDSQNHQDIIDQSLNSAEQSTEVYAPDVLCTDGQYVVFGTLRGILVYNLNTDSSAGTIDLQAIDSAYFNGDSMQTGVVMDGTDLYIFCEADNDSPKQLYKYSLPQSANGNLIPTEAVTDAAFIQQIYQTWKDQQTLADSSLDDYDKILNTYVLNGSETDAADKLIRFSKRCYIWNDSAGQSNISFLVLDNDVYTLYTTPTEESSLSQHELSLDVSTNDSHGFSSFVYTGDDKAVAAIIDYFQEDSSYYEEGCEIPEYVIYKEVQEGDEYLVFGNFYSHSYTQNGNILTSNSGGEYPACFHLKKTDTGYEVVSEDYAEDGDEFADSIKQFTKNYPGLYEQYMDYEKNKLLHEKARKEYLQMYVTNNHLDVKYYKDYGWDPVCIY